MCSRHKTVITNQHHILVDQVYKLIKKKKNGERNILKNCIDTSNH